MLCYIGVIYWDNGYRVMLYRGYRRDMVPATMENQMEKNMENEMDTGIP